jgi:hypothetical protein
MSKPRLSPDQLQDQLWVEIRDIALKAKGTADIWNHGYREGLIRAYCLLTGMDHDWVTGFLISEMRAKTHD